MRISVVSWSDLCTSLGQEVTESMYRTFSYVASFTVVAKSF